MVHEIDHIEYVVHDAEEMVAFLELMGFERHRETEHHQTSYEVTPGDRERPVIEIHTAETEEAVGVNHIAILVDDIEERTETLRDAGVTVDNGPHRVESTGRITANFRDPDGRRFQLVSTESDAYQ